MSKIVCDICGTSYPETAEQCPICGCSRDAAVTLLGEDLVADDVMEETRDRSGRFTTKKKEIFDFDEVNADIDDEEVDEDLYDEDEDDEEEERGHNTFVVILLTVLIVGLLAVAGFLFVRYFLPNMQKEEETLPPVVETEAVETTVPTTAYSIPCQNLVLTSGTAELKEAGQYFLLHVIAMPEDTTDEILYTSADESIATVTADGKITAVSEGETVIYITCGNSQLPCPVICSFTEETIPVTEATVVSTEPVETTDTETEETTGETTDETTGETVATEETKPAIAPGEVVLKLKKTDISLGVYLQYTLELDCALEATDVTWSSEHPHIASVDENGVVTAKKNGVTDIIVKYGDQEVRCKVRCSY